MSVWGPEELDMTCYRNKFVSGSSMERDIYRGFTALQEQGHDSGVLLFVDDGESYSVVGKVFGRALQDNEEKNAIVRAIIDQQNSIQYGVDTFYNGDGSSSGGSPLRLTHE